MAAPSSDMLLARWVPEIRNHSPLLNRRSQDRRNHVAPKSKPNPVSQKPNLTKTLLWACKLFLKSDIYSRTFVGRFVGISRPISRVKEFQNPTFHVSIVSQQTSIRCQYDEHALWSCSSSKRNLPFLQVHDHDHLLFGKSYNARSFGWRATATSKANLQSPTWGQKRYPDCAETRRSTSPQLAARQGLNLISRNRRAGCLQERK